jgi:hypothetical protein
LRPDVERNGVLDQISYSNVSMRVGTEKVVHLDLHSVRVGWGVGLINHGRYIFLNAPTNHSVLLQLFLHTKYVYVACATSFLILPS